MKLTRAQARTIYYCVLAARDEAETRLDREELSNILVTIGLYGEALWRSLKEAQ
jgi:hypothetical protein